MGNYIRFDWAMKRLLRNKANYAVLEGGAEGGAEGRAEEKKDIARNLKSLGLATEQIQTATGLTAEEIEGL